MELYSTCNSGCGLGSWKELNDLCDCCCSNRWVDLAPLLSPQSTVTEHCPRRLLRWWETTEAELWVIILITPDCSACLQEQFVITPDCSACLQEQLSYILHTALSFMVYWLWSPHLLRMATWCWAEVIFRDQEEREWERDRMNERKRWIDKQRERETFVSVMFTVNFWLFFSLLFIVCHMLWRCKHVFPMPIKALELNWEIARVRKREGEETERLLKTSLSPNE